MSEFTSQSRTTSLPPGTRLNDIYEIVALIGSGGMGSVYKGRAIETGDEVAIKTIRTDLAGDDAALALFRREAQALHQIHHEGVVRYFVFSIDRSIGCAYLAMEFVQGPSLAQVLKKAPLSFDATVALLKKVAGGMKAAHSSGIVHRDLSPDNIILPGGEPSRARIIDFGIARSLMSEGTVVGQGLAGKFGYMSPEQLGLFGGDVTPQSDVYSLGLVIAQCLLGHPINMLGTHAEINDKRRSVPDLSGVDRRIEPLLRHMLQPDPRERLSGMQAVLDWHPPTPDSAERRRAPSRAEPSGPKPPGKERKRKRISPALLSGVGLVLAAAGGFLAYRVLKAPDGDPALAYLAAYDGGSCFALHPTEQGPRVLKVDGYGHAIKDFEKFDEAFKNHFRYEAEIDLRQTTEQQCPAVNFINALMHGAGTAPRLTVDHVRVRSGDTMRGVFSPTQAWSALLLVSSEGTVTNVTHQVSVTERIGSFALPVNRSALGGGFPQLLIGLQDVNPWPAVDSMGEEARPASIFSALSAERKARGTSVAGSVVYFKVD